MNKYPISFSIVPKSSWKQIFDFILLYFLLCKWNQGLFVLVLEQTASLKRVAMLTYSFSTTWVSPRIRQLSFSTWPGEEILILVDFDLAKKIAFKSQIG
jgi:hypothetical protein